MEFVYLIVGVIVGGLLGYLWAARKSVSLRSELQNEPTACPGFVEGGKGTY